MAKMSGRGLGHTGGTVDKLESIPGFRTSLSRGEFLDTVRKTGAAIVGQSGNFAPADKKLYALRDVTATVDSIPLIASSIMSKKLAAGAHCILLDVKTGSGAFMHTQEDALKLAQTMVEIGTRAGRKTAALLTNMDRPLGFSIGNSLEVQEACRVLQDQGPEDLTELCLRLSAEIAVLAKGGCWQEWYAKGQEYLKNGRAFQKFVQMVEAQGGDSRVLFHPERFPKAKRIRTVYSTETGYLCSMDTSQCGMASVELGAGRERKEDSVDFSAGLVLSKKPGDFVKKGDVLAEFYAADEERCRLAEKTFRDSLVFGKSLSKQLPLVLARITAEGTEFLREKEETV